MKCNICGTSYDGKFCPNCGAPAETPVVNAAPSVPVAEGAEFTTGVSAVAGAPQLGQNFPS